ncbi:MAG: DoxX family protein [Conexivisphaerales archaeon]
MTSLLTALLFPYLPYIALIARVWYGINTMIHGYPKFTQRKQVIQMMAGWWGMQNSIGAVSSMVSIAALLEFVGGIFMIIGFLVPIVSLLYAIFFVSIIIMKKRRVKSKYIDPSGNSYEADALYLLLAIMLIFLGAGQFSIDSLIGF